MIKGLAQRIFSRSTTRGVDGEGQPSPATARHPDLARFLDAPVIVVPNEWENPTIGFGSSIIEVGTSAVLVVRDYIRMEDVACMGVRMDFTPQRLEVVLSLDPYQLWAIAANRMEGYSDFNKPKSGQRWDRERILSTLEENGFFHRWKEFQSSLPQPPPAPDGSR